MPLLSQLNASATVSEPTTYKIAEMHAHTISGTGNWDCGDRTYPGNDTLIFEPITKSISLRTWLRDVLTGPRSRYNYDKASPFSPQSQEGLGK